MNKDEMKNFLLTCILYDEDGSCFSEEVEKNIFKRYKEKGTTEYIFEPIQDNKIREKYIKLFNEIDKDPDILD